MPEVVVRYWAGAQRAAGHEHETVVAGTVGELRTQLADRPELTNVCKVASFLVNGVKADDATPLPPGAEVDVLPPFAGGALHIVGIGGSTNPDSVTNRLVDACLAEVAELGVRTSTVMGAELARLPIYANDADAVLAAPLLEAVRSADCIVLGTPGYHGGMSGLVKNALDHLEALRFDERPYLDGRAVGVIVTASGWQACGTTLVSVRSAVHALRGWPTPFGLTMNSAEQNLDDARIRGALRVLAGQLVDFASWQVAARASARSDQADAAR